LKNSNHIIEKVLVEVNTSNLETAHSIRNNIDVLMKNVLFPRLDLLFEEYEFGDSIIRFDDLTLNISVENGHDFSLLPDEIYLQLKKKIEFQLPALMEQKRNSVGSAEYESTNGRHSSENQKLASKNHLSLTIEQKNDTAENYGSEDGNDWRNSQTQQKEKSDLLSLPLQPKINSAESSESEKTNVQHISETQNSGSVFLFFLENGYLPWYGKDSQIKRFSETENWEKSLDDRAFYRSLDQMLGTSETAANRFILQFPDQIITAYLRRKNLRIHAETASILRISRSLDKDGRRIFLKLLIRLAHDDFPGVSKKLDRLISGVFKADGLSNELMALEQLKKLMERIIPETAIQDSVLEKIDLLIKGKPIPKNETHSLQETKSEAFLDQENDQIWVQNAGLILLHPFLKQFFMATGISGMQGNPLSENLDLAVHSLHFLATGDENAFEGNLVFEKFLCGVPLKMPVLRESLLSEPIKKEAIKLLEEVVRYWPELKNTSAEGLRQMFIQRDGKLIQEDTKYKLIVEHKAQDLLLERLNWNIAVIKLPWISKILFTEW
jgi:hypothetical protein